VKIADSITLSEFEEFLASPEAWSALLEETATPLDERVGYDEMLRFHRSYLYTISAPTEWHLLRAVKAVQDILPMLRGRRWNPFLRASGSFVGTDNQGGPAFSRPIICSTISLFTCHGKSMETQARVGGCD
jgi:hypothetical protein